MYLGSILNDDLYKECINPVAFMNLKYMLWTEIVDFSSSLKQAKFTDLMHLFFILFWVYI